MHLKNNKKQDMKNVRVFLIFVFCSSSLQTTGKSRWATSTGCCSRLPQQCYLCFYVQQYNHAPDDAQPSGSRREFGALFPNWLKARLPVLLLYNNREREGGANIRQAIHVYSVQQYYAFCEESPQQDDPSRTAAWYLVDDSAVHQ